MTRWTLTAAVVLVVSPTFLQPAEAQPLGTFRWQQQPYCNVVTVNVVQSGAVYQLDGFDDQCGAATLAGVVGIAFVNPDGTVGLGMTLVTTPGGTPLHLDAAIAVATGNGTWRDSAGNTGAFVLTPGAGVAGAARPTPRAAFPAGLSAGGSTITNVALPAAATDAVPRAYVDSAVATKANLAQVSRITYTGSTTLSEPTGNLVKLRDLGTFSKLATSTLVKLTLQTHVAMSAAGTSCAFQLRVDDVNSIGTTGFDGTEAIINSVERSPLAMTAVFTGLSTGSHTASLWVRGAGNPTCVDNAGNFLRSVLVEQ